MSESQHRNARILESGTTTESAELLLGFTITVFRWCLILRSLDSYDPFRARVGLHAIVLIRNLLAIITRAGIPASNIARRRRKMPRSNARGSDTVQLQTVRIRKDTLENTVVNSQVNSMNIDFRIPVKTKKTLSKEVNNMTHDVRSGPDPRAKFLRLRQVLADLESDVMIDLDLYFGGFLDLQITLDIRPEEHVHGGEFGEKENWRLLEDQLTALDAMMTNYDRVMNSALKTYKLASSKYLNLLHKLLKEEHMDPYKLNRVKEKKKKGRRVDGPVVASLDDEIGLLKKSLLTDLSDKAKSEAGRDKARRDSDEEKDEENDDP